MGLQSFDDLVAEFVAAPKKGLRKPRWRVRHHGDYASISMIITVDGERHLRGRIIVTAHRLMMPPKYCFSLLFRRQRVLALDVNPARSHRNLLAGGSVSITHWQRWPAMEAEPDGRDRTFPVWLHEFLVSANVTCNFGVVNPPRGKQLDLLND
jgi:hypothetical protein